MRATEGPAAYLSFCSFVNNNGLRPTAMLSSLRRLNPAQVIQSLPTQAKVRSPWVWKANSAPGGGTEYVRQVYGYEMWVRARLLIWASSKRN